MNTFVNLCALFDKGFKVAILKHPAELAKLKVIIGSLNNDLKLKKFELQTLPGLVAETAHLQRGGYILRHKSMARLYRILRQ